uniref:Uncharacterized protein n=1 Tax=Romanomermis culicivorax TaxID=13658 RepID=A0A915KZ48_ROMCU
MEKYSGRNFNCSDKSEGLYSNPFFACDSANYACSGICDIFDNVEACSNIKPRPPPEPEVWPTAMEVAVDFDCSNLLDGNHPEPKSTRRIQFSVLILIFYCILVTCEFLDFKDFDNGYLITLKPNNCLDFHFLKLTSACFGEKARQLEYGSLFYDPDNYICDFDDFIEIYAHRPIQQHKFFAGACGLTILHLREI